MIRQIRSLLYEQGFTISGARLQLQTEHARPMAKVMEAITAESTITPISVVEPSPSEAMLAYQVQISQNMLNVVIKDMIRELEAILMLLGGNVKRA
jgi:predicted LPLAT superfamily acyltransferase